MLLTILKWTGLLLCLLVVASFFVSIGHGITWTSAGRDHQLGIQCGAVGIGWRPDTYRPEEDKYRGSPGLSIGEYASGVRGPAELDWLPLTGRNRYWVWLAVPLWVVFLPIAGFTAWAWYVDRNRTGMLFDKLGRHLTPHHRRELTLRFVIALTLVYGAVVLASIGFVHRLISWIVANDAYFDVFINAFTVLVVLTIPIVGVTCAWLWVRFRNGLFEEYRAGAHCRGCGYDLTGNTSGVCPECGRARSLAAV